MYKYIFLVVIILINNTFGLYKLNVKKCNEYDDYSINYFRYQYDINHYPQFCNYNNKQYNFYNIENIAYSLERFWYSCNNENLDIYSYNQKNLQLWENMWYNFGSCSGFSQYRYFNISMLLFYNYKPKFQNCYYDKSYCDYYYDDEMFPIK